MDTQTLTEKKVNELLCALLPKLIEFAGSKHIEFTFELNSQDYQKADPYEYVKLLIDKLTSCNFTVMAKFNAVTGSMVSVCKNIGDSDDTISLTDLGLKLVKLKKEFGINMNESIYQGVCLLYSTKTAANKSS